MGVGLTFPQGMHAGEGGTGMSAPGRARCASWGTTQAQCKNEFIAGESIKMTIVELPFRATTVQACQWLAQQTGSAWSLTRLLEHGVTPYVWLDYDPSYPALFGDANGGYAAPIFFEGDTQRLMAGSEDVVMTMTKDVYRIVAHLKPPGFRRTLEELRFLKKDLTRLVAQLARAAQPKPAAVAPQVFLTGASESQTGISKDQVMTAFAHVVKMNLEHALGSDGGLFGYDGAKVKGTARKAKSQALWNPITFALGLHDLYKVPMPQLKRVFSAHAFLAPWMADWNQSLALLGK